MLHRYVCLLLAFVLSACGSNGFEADSKADRRTNGIDDTSLHAVMSEQLALDSARLNTLLFDLHRTETVLARERQQQASRIAASARSLQDGARKVLDLGQALPLADNSDTRFRTLAAQLESEADILATQAEMGQLTPTQMEETLSRLNDTCNACHSLYRDRAGTLR